MTTHNTNPEEYDLVVLGSGAGGKLIAWTSAQKGERVVVIERKYVGGSCPNIACMPSKNIIHSGQGCVVLSSQRRVRNQQRERRHQHGNCPKGSFFSC